MSSHSWIIIISVHVHPSREEISQIDRQRGPLSSRVRAGIHEIWGQDRVNFWLLSLLVGGED